MSQKSMNFWIFTFAPTSVKADILNKTTWKDSNWAIGIMISMVIIPLLLFMSFTLVAFMEVAVKPLKIIYFKLIRKCSTFHWKLHWLMLFLIPRSISCRKSTWHNDGTSCFLSLPSAAKTHTIALSFVCSAWFDVCRIVWCNSITDPYITFVEYLARHCHAELCQQHFSSVTNNHTFHNLPALQGYRQAHAKSCCVSWIY